jgi:membrane protein
VTTSEQQRRTRTIPDAAPLEAFTLRDRAAIVVAAVKRFLDDNGTMLASALAYSTFFAIPAVLLVAVGAFTLLVGPGTIASLMAHFRHVMPAQATSLLGGSLQRLSQRPSTGVAMTVVGGVLALWSTTGAMTSTMTAINAAYERKDKRSFLKKRLVALELVAVIGAAFLLVAVLLIFGPQLERLLAAHVGGAGAAVAWIWWIAQWPILLVGLLAAFSTLLYLGPDVPRLPWRFVTSGALVATAIWLAASGAFAVYTASFGSYDKTWGTLSAVIVMLTWLWLASIALLLGAEIDAETERRRGRL